jgi:hypothetical protein
LVGFWHRDVSKVWWDEAESKYKQSKIGLSQGAFSSIILFSIYINNIPGHFKKKIEGIKFSVFADDVMIKKLQHNKEPCRKLCITL